MATDDAIKERRHAREIVGEMRWRGMTVPPLYARMAHEFEDLVHSDDYATWVMAKHHPTRVEGKRRRADSFDLGNPGRRHTAAWDAPLAANPRAMSG
jgi:hypothetical protein